MFLWWYIVYVVGDSVLYIWEDGRSIGTGDVIFEFVGFTYDFVSFVILFSADDPAG